MYEARWSFVIHALERHGVRNAVGWIEDDGSHLESRRKKAKCPKSFYW